MAVVTVAAVMAAVKRAGAVMEAAAKEEAMAVVAMAAAEMEAVVTEVAHTAEVMGGVPLVADYQVAVAMLVDT